MISRTLKGTMKTLFVALGAAVVMTGCATSPNATATSPDYDAACIGSGEKLLSAYVANDGKDFVEQLPPSVQQQFTVESFKSTREAMQEAFGDIIKYEYLTKLDAPLFVPYLYRVRFRRDSANVDTDGVKKPIEQETLFRVVFAPLDGKPHVVSFGFL